MAMASLFMNTFDCILFEGEHVSLFMPLILHVHVFGYKSYCRIEVYTLKIWYVDYRNNDNRNWVLTMLYSYRVFFSFNSPYFINIGNHDLYPGRHLTTARPEEFRKTLETSIDLPSWCQVPAGHVSCTLCYCFWNCIAWTQRTRIARKDFQR